MLNTIREFWSWAGLDAVAITATNLFGNYIIRGAAGDYWRICPEHLSCERIASEEDEINRLINSDDFQVDWQMAELVALAHAKFGLVDEERCYCLKTPAVLGGSYDAANLGTISRNELIAFSGELAKQIRNVPDGEIIILRSNKTIR